MESLKLELLMETLTSEELISTPDLLTSARKNSRESQRLILTTTKELCKNSVLRLRRQRELSLKLILLILKPKPLLKVKISLLT